MNEDVFEKNYTLQESQSFQSFIKTNDMINTKELANQRVLLDKLKKYVHTYDLIPVLIKAFINDNLTFYKSTGIPNDDFLLANYISDLYLSFQKNEKLNFPDEDIINEIFDCCMEIYQSCFIIEMTGDKIDENIRENILTFKYTERTFYFDVFAIIFFNIVNKEYLSYFYDKKGFYLQNIFVLRNAITCLIQDRLEKKIKYDGCIIAFSAEELFVYVNNSYHNKLNIDLQQIQNFIDYFLIDSSDNSDYLPRYNNSVSDKPIFRYENKYICSEPLRLIKNIFMILDNELKKDKKVLDKYFKSRGYNLEILAGNMLRSIFPEAEIYQGLNYITNDQKEHETDIIIDLGNYLIIVEAKSGKFRSQAKEGNSKIYNNCINKIITDAHEQCKTTYEYIQENEISKFYKKEQIPLEVSFKKKNYIDMFLVTVELENLESITSDIYRTIPVYKYNPILTFSIYDLYIIVDILKNGSLFLIYLDQRRKCVFDERIHASNELDYFSLFLDHDLKFPKKDEFGNKISEISIDNYSDILDKHYIEDKKINFHSIAVGANILFQQLRNYNKKLAFVIEKEFCTANIQIQKDILRKIEMIKKKALSDNKGHDCSFLLEDGNVGVSFFAYKRETFFSDEYFIHTYVKNKIMQTKVKFWFYAVFSVKPNRVFLIDFLANKYGEK